MTLEPTAANPDAALISLIGEFHEAHTEAKPASERWVSEKDRVEALPECPPDFNPRDSQEGYERHEAFLTEHGVHALVDHSEECWRRTGALANRISATPAKTFVGVFEKLKIVRLATGDDAGTGDHDESLNAYHPDTGVSWFASVMSDFERIIGHVGGDADDPFVDLAKRYVAAVDAFDGNRVSDEEIENYDVKVLMPLEQQLAKLRPISRKGVVAAIDLVLREQRYDSPGNEPSCWSEEYVVGLLQNARSAVGAGQHAI